MIGHFRGDNMKNVLITGINSDFDNCLAKKFMAEGYDVFILEDGKTLGVEKLDFFIDTTDYVHENDGSSVREGVNWDAVEATFRNNPLKSMALLEAHLPLLDAGEEKRLFYLTQSRASINETESTTGYGYNMSKTALHMFIHLSRNKLAPLGYTFRVFDPLTGIVDAKAAAESAFTYITRRRGTDGDDGLRDDEDNLVIWDALGRKHSW